MNTPLEEFYITMPEGVPAQADVNAYVSSNGEGKTDPLWAVVCVFIGAFLLVGTGAFLIAVGVAS